MKQKKPKKKMKKQELESEINIDGNHNRVIIK